MCEYWAEGNGETVKNLNHKYTTYIFYNNVRQTLHIYLVIEWKNENNARKNILHTSKVRVGNKIIQELI